ncbi:hypothetical protein CEXT_780651 [Caerostris extrusa]|uniref:Uncharacterized protein n=1 Tax=Caerostris extrusa TaxID=172846 RepID=A0AAV4TSH2_CAEEX|nr:hypothetical protein CEXT_780651 [Caerostris extrusa]
MAVVLLPVANSSLLKNYINLYLPAEDLECTPPSPFEKRPSLMKMLYPLRGCSTQSSSDYLKKTHLEDPEKSYLVNHRGLQTDLYLSIVSVHLVSFLSYFISFFLFCSFLLFCCSFSLKLLSVVYPRVNHVTLEEEEENLLFFCRLQSSVTKKEFFESRLTVEITGKKTDSFGLFLI